MHKFYVSFPVFAHAGMTVEAETQDDAIKIAEDELYPSLCHQCAREIDLGDLDYEHVTVDPIE